MSSLLQSKSQLSITITLPRELISVDGVGIIDTTTSIDLSLPEQNVYVDYSLFLVRTILEDLNYIFKRYDFENKKPILQNIQGQTVGNNYLIYCVLDYDQEEIAYVEVENYVRINAKQLSVYGAITACINSSILKNFFFLYSPTSTRKTFLYTILATRYRTKGKIVLYVASSRIASLLLLDSVTSYIQFRIPISITEGRLYFITNRVVEYKLLQETSLIIQNEVPIQKQYNFKAIYNTLYDIKGFKNPQSYAPFIGIPTILRGNFVQILPIKKDNKDASTYLKLIVKNSDLQHLITILHLTKNIRLIGSDEQTAYFIKQLTYLVYDLELRIGIDIPPIIRVLYEEDAFLKQVFPIDYLYIVALNPSFFESYTILYLKNKYVY